MWVCQISTAFKKKYSYVSLYNNLFLFLIFEKKKNRNYYFDKKDILNLSTQKKFWHNVNKNLVC